MSKNISPQTDDAGKNKIPTSDSSNAIDSYEKHPTAMPVIFISIPMHEQCGYSQSRETFFLIFRDFSFSSF